LDGVRALWTGDRFLSRNGNEFHAPSWFKQQLPPITLDGELWMGRGKFQKTVGIVKRQTPEDSDWRAVRFMVFDAPTASGGFEARLAFATEAISGCRNVAIVSHRVCRDARHLREYHSGLAALGAEGVMLRAPGSAYEQGRSHSLLKVKRMATDEAIVTGHEPGFGKYVSLTGALAVRWNGVEFRVGSGLTDEQRSEPPRIGSVITFQYHGLTDAGVPRFPTFLTARDYE